MPSDAYWETFYQQQHTVAASPFAYFVYKEIVCQRTTPARVADIGCGNGRDSLFFADRGCSVIAVDSCAQAVRSLPVHPMLTGACECMSRIGTYGVFDVIYSRFSMHSVTADVQEACIQAAYTALQPGGTLAIEVRSVKGAFTGDHFRRFIDAGQLAGELINAGFVITHLSEKRGYAVYKDEDPVIIRGLATKVAGE